MVFLSCSASFCLCSFQRRALAAFLPLVWKLWIVNIERGTVSAAVGFNMWWVYGSMFVGVLGMTVYYAVNTIRCIIALVETCRGDKTGLYAACHREKRGGR